MLHARIEGEQRFFADAAIDTNVYVGKGKGYRHRRRKLAGAPEATA
jgi:hypothetical protein